MKLRNLFAAAVAGSALLAAPVMADAAKGLEIAIEADKRNTGFGDTLSQANMVLRNAQGRETTRKMRISTLETPDDGDKSITVFDYPRDVKGIALLTWSHKEGSDDQWIYFPARKRTRRIASDNKSGPFMGSEFAYEDISSQEVEQYTYKYLRDDNIAGADVFVSERYPTDKNSGYTRQVVYMDKAEYRVRKIDYYDRKDSLLKTLQFADYKQYEGKFWRPHSMKMVNHQTKKETDLTFDSYSFKTGLDAPSFEQNRLRNVR